MNFYRLSNGQFVEERGQRTCLVYYSKSVPWQHAMSYFRVTYL